LRRCRNRQGEDSNSHGLDHLAPPWADQSLRPVVSGRPLCFKWRKL
jgi:hypothetical protein